MTVVYIPALLPPKASFKHLEYLIYPCYSAVRTGFPSTFNEPIRYLLVSSQTGVIEPAPSMHIFPDAVLDRSIGNVFYLISRETDAFPRAADAGISARRLQRQQ